MMTTKEIEKERERDTIVDKVSFGYCYDKEKVIL